MIFANVWRNVSKRQEPFLWTHCIQSWFEICRYTGNSRRRLSWKQEQDWTNPNEDWIKAFWGLDKVILSRHKGKYEFFNNVYVSGVYLIALSYMSVFTKNQSFGIIYHFFNILKKIRFRSFLTVFNIKTRLISNVVFQLRCHYCSLHNFA